MHTQMMTTTIRSITLGASIGAAVSGGVFFGFSTFVMKALGRLPAEQAVGAMQSINRFAPNPPFMAALFGTAVACVPVSVAAVRHLDDPASTYALIGSALYIAGVILTVAYHVPCNNALARIDPTSPGIVADWDHYRSGWTGWNHVRTLTSISGAALLLVATRVAAPLADLTT